MLYMQDGQNLFDEDLSYSGEWSLRGVNLSVREGELVALIGSNGAGKSTCLKALAGILRPVQGSIRLSGEELSAEPAHRIVSRGIVLVPEGRRLFADQTVMDNLLLGAYRRKGGSGEKGLRALAEEYLDHFPICASASIFPRGD